MKILTCLFMMLFVSTGYAQSDDLLNKIAQEINDELKGSPLRDQIREITFYKNKENGLSFSRSSNDTDERIMDVLCRHVDSFEKNVNYSASIFYDIYIDKAYAVVYRSSTATGFPNYDTYRSLPKKGFKYFNKALYTDLKVHQSALDSLNFRDWNTPIELLVDSTEKLSIINGGKLLNYLDSSLRISWHTSLYYGSRVATISKIKIKKEELLSNSQDKNYFNICDIEFMRVLSNRFKNNLVKFETDKKTQYSEICVSLIYNPITSKLEEEVILQGNSKKAKEFITWLKSLYWPSSKFYWNDYRRATRVFFYISPDSTITL